MLANTPAMLEAPLRRADGGRRAQHAEHAARRRDHRLHARSCGDQGPDHRPRILRASIKEALALREGKARFVIDYDDPGISGPGERLGAIEYEAFLAEGDPEFAWQMPGRRMGRDLAQLHLGHDRRPQGRRLPSSRRLSAGGRQCADRRHGRRHPVYLWTLPMFHCNGWCFPWSSAGGRHACLPAPGAREGDLRCDRRAQGHASVRRADRDVDAAQRADAEKKAAATRGRVHHRRGAAAGSGARRDEGGGLQRHPCLRPDRNLWPGRRQRMACRMERPRLRPSRRPGRRARACAIRRSRRSTSSIPKPCSRCPPTATRSAR